ncbi:hypothetical protein BDN70DRAFT_871822 [Pholiota conissans]|uniref:MYND-type domain-containing protein n=1 Tax=Pholiota conissans TaxID=109636 RepID=A0A9P5ZCV6_9AGAR|nr:hypothetical protein BDN70DRAFT_871822 [Pholiota conissans]
MPPQKPKHKVLSLEEELQIASTLAMTHPSERPLNQQQSSRDIKKKMKEACRLCEYCRQRESKDEPFKACAKCQSSFYCSKECQRVDWPEHKTICAQSQRHKRLEKLATTLTANVNLFDYLKLAIVLNLDLLNSSPTELFTVLVPLVVEPEDILDFARLRGQLPPSTTTLSTEKPAGMLQVGGILPSPPGLLSEESVLELTSNARAERDASWSAEEAPVGVIVFVLGNMDTRSSIDAPVIIPPHVMKMAKKAQPFKQNVPTASGCLLHPMDQYSCIEYINTSIRLDKENQFLLRREMTPSDVQIIRTSATKFDRFLDVNFPCILIQRRMQTEFIYRPLLDKSTSDFGPSTEIHVCNLTR